MEILQDLALPQWSVQPALHPLTYRVLLQMETYQLSPGVSPDAHSDLVIIGDSKLHLVHPLFQFQSTRPKPPPDFNVHKSPRNSGLGPSEPAHHQLSGLCHSLHTVGHLLMNHPLSTSIGFLLQYGENHQSRFCKSGNTKSSVHGNSHTKSIESHSEVEAEYLGY